MVTMGKLPQTPRAKKVIEYAIEEARNLNHNYVGTEHLLLGLLREDKALANRFLRSHAAIESIRKQIEAHTTIREKVSTSVDLPLSHECKRVLAYGAEEAENDVLGQAFCGHGLCNLFFRRHILGDQVDDEG
jgi:ATP-dependent Clp protease ATP-binding subunit ClpA